MTRRWLPVVVVGAAVLAVWGGARYPGCLTALATVALVAVLWLQPQERRMFSPGWAGLALLVLAVAWVVALDHELAFRQTQVVLIAAALFGLARLAAPDDRHVGVLALAIAATVAVALAQFAGGPERAQSAVAGMAPELRDLAAQRLAVGRYAGTAALPGHFAALLVMATPLLAQAIRRWSGWRRALAVVGVVACAAGIVLSRSLAGVMLAVAVGSLAIMARRSRWQAQAVGGVLLVVVAVATLLLRSDLARLEPLRLRWINWTTTAWVLAHHPLLGVGFGGVGQAGLLAPEGAANITPYAHNSYLQLTAELGLPGVALLVAGVTALLHLARAGWRDHLPLVLAVAIVPLHNLVDFSVYAPEVVLPWAVLLGTLAARVAPLPRRPLPSWLLVPVLGATVLLSAASWRAEVLLSEAYTAPTGRAVTAALRAAEWAPWSIRPLLSAAGTVLGARDPRAATIEKALAGRWWVLPRSSAWAEMRARLLLAGGRPGEAAVWAREARRRAPWRGELASLEATCLASS